MSAKRITEPEVAEAAAGLLRRDGWDVYQEITVGGPRLDLAGERGGATWAIECKTRLSLDLIDQAEYWIGKANRVCVCVPERKGYSKRLPSVVCRQLGIGILAVRHRQATWHLPSRWMRPQDNDFLLRRHLLPEHMTMGEAGSKGGGYYTPWKGTMRRVAERVAANPGITIKEVVETTEHHYTRNAGARQGIAFAIREGLITDIRSERNGGTMRLYPVTT